MISEEPLSLWVSSHKGETKLMPDHRLEEDPKCCTDATTDAPLTDSEEPFCRICHEGKNSGELLSPCECSGSLAMVHQACLEHWLTASNSSHCELCHYQFALERLPKPLTEWLCTPSMQQQRRTLYGDVVCFLFITPLASLSGWLCVKGAMDLYLTNGMEALGLLVLTLALFTIYVFWAVVSLRYHMQRFNIWKNTNQRVRLLIPPPSNTTCYRTTLSVNAIRKATNKGTPM